MTQDALIFGHSGGIGGALARHLTGHGWHVTGRSRAEGLDFDHPERVEKVLAALAGPFDLILIATGGLEVAGHPPEKALKQITPAAMEALFRLNTVGPAMIMAHVPRLLARDGRVAALSARVGSIGDNRLGGWHSYRAAKAALNQIMHGAAIELARTHKDALCVALHPGTVETRLTTVHGRGHDKVTPTQAAANLMDVLNRLDSSDSGGFFDWRGAPIAW